MIRSRFWAQLVFALALLLQTAGSWGQDGSFPEPSNLGDPGALGRGVQRTMSRQSSMSGLTANNLWRIPSGDIMVATA